MFNDYSYFWQFNQLIRFRYMINHQSS